MQERSPAPAPPPVATGTWPGPPPARRLQCCRRNRMNKSSGRRSVIRPTSAADRASDELWRAAYVANQQEVARHALCMGSPGAARAALRVLNGEDFLDHEIASFDLSTLRHRAAAPQAVLAAIHRLIRLEPGPSVPEDTGQFVACDPGGRARTESETD